MPFCILSRFADEPLASGLDELNPCKQFGDKPEGAGDVRSVPQSPASV
jgi:hypothetical protein